MEKICYNDTRSWRSTGNRQKFNIFHISGCSAVGSARGLGACDCLGVRPKTKSPKSLVNTGFQRPFRTQKLSEKIALTTDLTTYRKTLKFNIFYISGCSAVGSAPGLGASYRPRVRPRVKPSENLVVAGFQRTFRVRKPSQKNALTTDLTTYKNSIFSPFGM